MTPAPKNGKPQFDRVDRALEMQVIDWLQWAKFPEILGEPDYPQLALTLIAKRKAAYARAIEVLKQISKRFCHCWDKCPCDKNAEQARDTLKELGELHENLK